MNRFDLAQFLPFRLNRLADEMSQRLSAIYGARFSLDIPQWRVLATLASTGPITAQSIVASTRTHKSTISRAVANLTSRGLIERVPSNQDGRAMELQLTGRGRRVFANIEPMVLEFERRLVGEIGSGKTRALLEGIGALEGALGLLAEDERRQSETR